ncbi:dephospho-CoA kinase [Clostridium tetani 12124569]|nr:dephospho-CoA kinase [Clostridium tetani 12124569]
MMLSDVDLEWLKEKYCVKNKGKFFKIGLTGGIASGKSTISNMFKSRGIDVIDADKIAREVLEKYPSILEYIKENFGEQYIDEFGNLNRREFGNHIFSISKEERKKYENIIMPYIKLEIENQFKLYEKIGKKVCLLDAPLLIEQGMQKDLDFTLLSWVNKKIQIKRVGIRDNLQENEILNRIEAQIPLDEKRELVDFIIDNSNTIEETKVQVEKLFQFINCL